MSEITLELLREQVDFDAAEAAVKARLDEAAASDQALLRFIGRYTSWNGFFGSAVATLAGKIGRCRRMFLDPAEPVHALADRSVFVASFFFDAARDEFDDRDTEHRDTHRCLAQAVVGGIVQVRGLEAFGDAAAINRLLSDPLWLTGLQDRVALGYGAGSADDRASVFRAMGYHLGSEVLADQEFSLIDETFRREQPALVQALMDTRVEIAGREHVAYQWIRIHSGHGGGAEADHFDWAMKGVRRGFKYVKPELHDELVHQILLGFRDFASDHAEFFERVNR